MTTIHPAGTGAKSLYAIARELVAAWHDPETPVTWTRNGVPIFTRDQALAWWAERTAREGAPAALRGAEGGQ